MRLRTLALFVIALAWHDAGLGQPTLDPEEATEAYLATVSDEDRERSDSYFEGGYWLQLTGYLYGLGVAWILLSTRLSARMRERAERRSGRGFVASVLYFAQYIIALSLLTFPLAVYQGFIREHQYGLATQTFGPWLRDQAVGLAVGLVLGSIAISGIYQAIRKTGSRWWLYGAGGGMLFLAFVNLIGPVFIAPLFNDYVPLEDAAITEPVLAMARANGVPVDNVYQFDASRQSTRISANVSGFLSTMRVSLNDNLLERCSLEEIKAVMGHEIGHYALGHVWENLLFFGVVLTLGLGFIHAVFERLRARWGERFGISDIGDIAGLPLMAAILSTYFFVMTPVLNSHIRTNEAEADIFGLNAAREPDGFATVSLKLGEYRKLAPGPLEELLFFDHPSGHSRILMAMTWKAHALPAAEPTRENKSE